MMCLWYLLVVSTSAESLSGLDLSKDPKRHQATVLWSAWVSLVLTPFLAQ